MKICLIVFLLNVGNFFNTIDVNINFGIFNETEVDKFNKTAMEIDFKHNIGSVFAKHENDITRYNDYIDNL